MFLLDTNVLSELRNACKADAQVLAWAREIAAEQLFISAITIFEIERGILRIARRDARQALVLRSWLDDRVLPQFGARILPVDTRVAQRCAPLHVSDPKPERDSFIAATALVHGLTVVTRNAADFTTSGVLLLNPWLPARG
jgi:predicted nucleic acid-binding protein